MLSEEYLDVLHSIALATENAQLALRGLSGRTRWDDTEETGELIALGEITLRTAITELQGTRIRLVRAAESAQIDLDRAEEERGMVPF